MRRSRRQRLIFATRRWSRRRLLVLALLGVVLALVVASGIVGGCDERRSAAGLTSPLR